MYEYHQNKISIPAKLLYEEWNLMSYDNYKAKCKRGQLIKTQRGGRGNEAFVSYYDLPDDIKEVCLKKLGDPKKEMTKNKLESYLTPDIKAASFYSSHRKPNGKPLSKEKQIEKTTNCIILNAINTILEDRGLIGKLFGKKKTRTWQNISKAVNNLSPDKWSHSLPGNYRRLQAKYEAYLEERYELFIHGGEGKINASKIKGDIAEYILAQYSLPTKYSIPVVIERYNEIRKSKKWPPLTEQGVYNWLHADQERVRVWTLGRHGKNSYDKKFKHTLSRDKSSMFPNAYWAIDGTKLDWIHYWDDASNKMGAKLKIDVMFDVYSEKIIGYVVSDTESHLEHFEAVKMSVNESKCKPYLLTYDQQSGHKMQRMQELYSSIIASEGTHYCHKSKEHNSPAEQLFSRFQKQQINNFWFSDGQSITVRREDNKANWDFIDENSHLWKTVDELVKAFDVAVKNWNEAKHPHFDKPRNEVYQEPMPQKEELNLFDIMNKMWLVETKPVTYKPHGLDLKVGKHTHQFEVYTEDNKIDIDFRLKNVGKKFIVRYDPDLLDTYVSLCERNEAGEIIEIATAEPKRKHQPVPVLMQEGDKEQWAEDVKVRDIEYQRDLSALQALRRKTGITPESEIESQELNIKRSDRITKQQQKSAEESENAFARL